MSTPVPLPALGESVTEGTVSRWLKQVGDTVEVDEPIVEVSTDKVDTEIPSPAAGVSRAIRVAEDDGAAGGAGLGGSGGARRRANDVTGGRARDDARRPSPRPRGPPARCH